jgi:hypothetical protein
VSEEPRAPKPKAKIEVEPLGDPADPYGYHVRYESKGRTIFFNLLEDCVMSSVVATSPTGTRVEYFLTSVDHARNCPAPEPKCAKCGDRGKVVVVPAPAIGVGSVVDDPSNDFGVTPARYKEIPCDCGK